MSDKNNIYKIAKLIFKKNFSSLNEMENSIIEEWLAKDSSNEKLLRELSEESNIPKHFNDLSSFNKDAAYALFTDKVNKKSVSIPLYRRVMKYAAIFIIPVLLAGGVYFLTKNISFDNKKEIAANTVIPPGDSKATLQMADGSKIILTGRDKSELVDKDGTLIKSDSTHLDYSQSKAGNAIGNRSAKLAMNTLSVPRQGEYKLTLEDGTKVWVNSDTKLTYPTHFDKKSRYVILEGEAYFEVTKDKKRPFIVKSGETEVKVLGTEFNINAYPDNENIKTTLVDGKVAFSHKVQNQRKQVVLNPGHQAVVNNGVVGIEVNKVNTMLYTAWKDGRFVFEDESFDNIMKILSRWYDVEVFFQNNALKELRFSGDLKRFENINSHLKMLGMTTNVLFSVKGKVVWVREKY